MTRDTDNDWQRLADENPYWGILSRDTYQKENITPRALEEFFESGHQYVTALMRQCRRHIDPKFSPRRALDFGCGVGRITFALAGVAEEVVGVDVAQRMLDRLEEHKKERREDRVKAVLGDDELSNVKDNFDLVNSFIVLQHIDPDRGLRIITRLMERVNPGGVAALHLTYGKSKKFWHHEARRAEFYRREGSWIKDLVPCDDARPQGAITMFDYDLNQVFATMAGIVRGPIISIQTNHDGHLGMQLICQKG